MTHPVYARKEYGKEYDTKNMKNVIKNMKNMTHPVYVRKEYDKEYIHKEYDTSCMCT